MTELLEEISQISIYLKDETERINEIALFQPLAHKAEFDETSKPIHQRKWSFTHNLPFLQRVSLKVQTFLYKRIPLIIPEERLTKEAKFKTALSLLLAQESLREFFFANEKRRRNFIEAVRAAAHSIGFNDFSLPNTDIPLKMCYQMTTLRGKKRSLIEDLPELNLQMAALKESERNEILFRILNQVERPPITSILEVMCGEEKEEISLTTKYAKYKVLQTDPDTGRIHYSYKADEATSSIKTRQNSLPGAKGAMNQRCALDAKSGEWIGSYSGELSIENHLLEQLFFILQLKGEEVHLVEHAPYVEERRVLLTSLFSWHEIALLTDQQRAIRTLNKRILKIGSGRYVQLNLLHFNISFNVLNKYPSPAEMGAVMRDINDQTLIVLMADLWRERGLFSETLFRIKEKLGSIDQERNFFKHQSQILDLIDTFREIKKELIEELEQQSESIEIQAALALLKGKGGDGRALKGMDLLLYLNTVAKGLSYFHNKNCQNSTDRTAGANAADKAQYAYQKIYRQIFLPGLCDQQELSLFKVLYSMYLVWEEPEINAALSTGFIGEKFYHNFFQKNPETTRYLIQWLKKHPEIYLGLSDLRY